MRNYCDFVMKFSLAMILLVAVVSCSKGRQDVYVKKDADDNLYSSLLFVEKKEVRLGEVEKKENESVNFLFNIENTSDSILVIDKIDVSCSCVEITDFPKQLEVGQSGEITGKIDLRNQIGHIRKSIFVNYCDTCIAVMKIVADVIE